MKRLGLLEILLATFIILNTGCEKKQDSHNKKPENKNQTYYIDVPYDSSFEKIEMKWRFRYKETYIRIDPQGEGVNVTFTPREVYYFEKKEVYMPEVFELLLKGKKMYDIEEDALQDTPSQLKGTILN